MFKCQLATNWGMNTRSRVYFIRAGNSTLGVCPAACTSVPSAAAAVPVARLVVRGVRLVSLNGADDDPTRSLSFLLIDESFC